MNKKPNKQHDARAASFKRIAKGLRATALRYYKLGSFEALVLNEVARENDKEAARLRAMR